MASDFALLAMLQSMMSTTAKETNFELYELARRLILNGVTISSTGVISWGPVVSHSTGPFFLGGSAIEYVQSAAPTWVSSSASQIVLDSTLRSATATITVRLRATSGSVTARLQNTTDNVTVGTGNLVTSATYVTDTFTATITPGVKTYELQVLPSLANTDVSAVGYLE